MSEVYGLQANTPLPVPLVFWADMTRDEKGWFGHTCLGVAPAALVGPAFGLGPED